MFLTGIRSGEAVTLTWADLVAWQGNPYLDIFGKGSKARRVYLPDEAWQALADYGRSIGMAAERLDDANLLPVPGAAARGGTASSRGSTPRDELLTRPLFASLRRPAAPITRHGLYALVKKWCGRVIGRTDVSPTGSAIPASPSSRTRAPAWKASRRWRDTKAWKPPCAITKPPSLCGRRE